MDGDSSIAQLLTHGTATSQNRHLWAVPATLF
jgi:hypothetical protein